MLTVPPWAGSSCWGVVIAALFVATVAPLGGQQLNGRIIDSATGYPIPNAQVSIVDPEGRVLSSVLSGSGGVFAARMTAADSVYVYVEAVGYLAMVDGPVVAAPGAEALVEFALRAVPIAVEGVTVTSERRMPELARVGFYDRRTSGAGHQLDRSILDRRGRPAIVSDWLRGVPGVSIDNGGALRLRGMSSVRGECPYRVFLDGILVVSAPFDEDKDWERHLIRPDDVEAIEVYARPSEVPAQYGGAQGGCGVILVWSRR